MYKKYIEDNNLALVTFKNVELIQTINTDYLEKTNNIKEKYFTFLFD